MLWRWLKLHILRLDLDTHTKKIAPHLCVAFAVDARGAAAAVLADLASGGALHGRQPTTEGSQTGRHAGTEVRPRAFRKRHER